MAIIRKGDKEAEAKLAKRAEVQNKGKRKTNNTHNDPGSIYIGKDKKSGKSKANSYVVNSKTAKVEGKEYKKPISGRAVAERKKVDKVLTSFTPAIGSGVIEKGKLVKGGNTALKDSLNQKGKK